MLYKYLFSILYGHLNLNQNSFEFGRLPVKPTGKPAKPAGKPAKPAGKPVQPTGIPVRTGWTAKFEFHRFRPVTGQTRPVYRYRSPAVWPDRSEIKTLVGIGRWSPSDGSREYALKMLICPLWCSADGKLPMKSRKEKRIRTLRKSWWFGCSI